MKIEITIPENLNDITLEQYQDWEASEKTNEDLLRIFCRIKYVDKLHQSDFNRLVEQVSNALNQRPTFQQRFKYNGSEWGFIPNLDKITYGENKDVTTPIA